MMIERIAVIGAGNGGKATAVDLALQGKSVRLCEFPEFSANLAGLGDPPLLHATGALEGTAELRMVTSDFAAAIGGGEGVDCIVICTQALAHARVAREILPLVSPEQIVVISPGSTGGSLEFAHVFRQSGITAPPVLAEFHTLPYGCRAAGADITISVKVRKPILYATLPGKAAIRCGPALEALFPSLVRAQSVLEVGLNNANPIIHPPITLLNASRIETEGSKMLFYRDGVSPAVAALIRRLDEERMALLGALGYPARPEPETSSAQGYCNSSDYLECYSRGPGFISFPGPSTIDHRYLHEDCGVGLVMFCSLGRALGVPTPTCEAVVRFASAVTGVDYLSVGSRTLERLGLDGLGLTELKSYLETGALEPPQNS
jgi:opine dehydrogenase